MRLRRRALVSDPTGRAKPARLLNPARVQRLLVELARDVEDTEALNCVELLQRVVTGNLRLLIGIVRANHPWRLMSSLSDALVGAVGVGTFAIVTSDVWRIAARIGGVRLALVCAATLASSVATLIAAHGLWERAADRNLREQAVLFNVVTLITVAFGILALYAAVCLPSLAGAWLLVTPSLMSHQIGHRSGVGHNDRLALLVAAMASVGGSPGSALESDAAVREAAYGYRPSDR
jgi:uncharacterized membrane protein